MAEIRNCPSCGELFNYIGIKDICNKCARKEEEMYEVVYRFLRKRENRAATVERIVEVTGVEEELLYKWVRKGRLQPALFPNLGYPCDNCGRLTNHGKLCDRCKEELTADLRTFEAAKEFRENVARHEKATYLSEKRK
ncbi:TIGR03826 family flagellar region protein [Ureibacillus sp. NPDC094379]